jgi:putative spermidine/putrescine transport system ATP-binding protein
MREAVGLEGITKSYGPLKVLENITLSVPSGVFAAILGPSGCGKSTLLKAIAGLVKPDSGEVRLGGQPIDPDLPPEARSLGVMFQEPALFPHMTVFENVAFPLRVRGASDSDIKATVDTMLDLTHLASQAQVLPSVLSGGQQQRVALCRALVFGPSVVLLDEPLSALDRPLRESLQRELVGMQRCTGATFLMVTHDREEAMAIADWMIVMNDGLVVQDGRPSQLYRAPRSRFVAEFFVGSAVVKGEVCLESDGGWYIAGPGGLKLHVGQSALAQNVALEVAIRPDQVRIHRGQINHFPGACLAIVEEIRFAGPVLSVTLNLGQGRLAAQVSAIEYEDLKKGDEVVVVIEAIHTVPLSM